MLRSLFLAAVLLTKTASAYGDDPKPPLPAPSALERIETLQKDLNKKIADLQADVAALKAQVAQSGVLLDAWEAQNRLDTLQTEVNRLRDQLAQAGGRSAAGPSTSNLGPQRDGYNRMPDSRRDSFRMDTTPRESRRPALGFLRVANEAAFAHEVMLNGQRFFIGAFETVDLPVPAGEFTYQVLGRTALRTRTVGANQVFSATIQP